MLDMLNTPVIALLALLAFIYLAGYSLQHSLEKTGYTQSEFSVLDKKAASFQKRQAQALKEIYNITDDDIGKPVRLFGE